MWNFAVGMFLITLSPGSLRLTAIYGFMTGLSTLLFGALIGDAVDRYHRLRGKGKVFHLFRITRLYIFTCRGRKIDSNCNQSRIQGPPSARIFFLQ